MLCIFFISPGGICESARATAAAGEELRNNTAPSPAYCARSEGMQRAVAKGGGFESAGGREDIGVVEVQQEARGRDGDLFRGAEGGDRGGWRWYYTVGQQRGSSSCPASRGEVAVERVDMRQNGVGVEERLVGWYR